MNAERWQKIKTIFQSLIELPAAHRAQALDEACAGDETLRAEVAVLLDAHMRAENFIEEPALQMMKRSAGDITLAQASGSNALIDPSAFPITNWDHYEFVEFIGAGGMGKVYKARDLRLNRYVALKFLQGQDQPMLERFLQEARAQAQIEHEHICKVYEVGEAQGYSYIAMQFIKGRSLKQAKDELNLEQKIKVMKKVAEALHSAHRLNLIHRDIKPANILVEQTEGGIWQPYIVDFGLAREIEAEGMTITGMVMGTPSYMSPEQVANAFTDSEQQEKRQDQRTDIYSLGATLYELLSGQPPFRGGISMESLFRILHFDATPLRKLDNTIPAELETIVMKCLEKEPARRYQSARALADDLQRYLDGEPIAARPASLAYRLWKRARKQKAALAAFTIAIVVMLIMAAAVVQERWRARARAMVAQQLGQDFF